MELVTATKFKALHLIKNPAANGWVRRAALPLVGVRKQSVEAVEEIEERTLRFTLSTGTVDRDQDMIDPAGWQLDHYRKNPIVLWAHKHDMLPIGKAVDTAAIDGRLVSAVRFLPAAGYGTAGEFADSVYRLAKDGYLAATSVGFRPLAWDFSADVERGAEDWFPGIDYHEQELVEFSIVGVPSNPEALIEPVEPSIITDPTSLIEAPSPVASFAAARARRRRAIALAAGGFT
jgi:hypothetical protein